MASRGLTIAQQRVIIVSGRSLTRSVVPISGADHQWNYTNRSETVVEDIIGDAAANYNNLSWGSDSGPRNMYAVLDGDNDVADLGDGTASDWLHFVSQRKGTLFSWIKPTTLSGTQYIISAGYDGSQANRSISFRLNDDTIEINVFDGEGNKLYEHRGGSISASDWSAVAMTVDGNTSKLYMPESDNHTVTEVSSSSVSSDQGSGDLDGNAKFGDAEFLDGSYGGGKSVTFKDSDYWPESNLQGFVDDTKKFYL